MKDEVAVDSFEGWLKLVETKVTSRRKGIGEAEPEEPIGRKREPWRASSAAAEFASRQSSLHAPVHMPSHHDLIGRHILVCCLHAKPWVLHSVVFGMCCGHTRS
jgi:hypothetical protein